MTRRLWIAYALICLIIIALCAAFTIIAAHDREDPPLLVHVDTRPLCESVNRKAMQTLRRCERTTETLKARLDACRRTP